MRIMALYFLSTICSRAVGHSDSPLDGTHTDTLALILMITGILLAAMACSLIVKGCTQQTSGSSDKKIGVTSISNKRMG